MKKATTRRKKKNKEDDRQHQHHVDVALAVVEIEKDNKSIRIGAPINAIW